MTSGPEAKLIKLLRADGRRVYGDRLEIVKYHGSQFSEAGVSDFLCCLDGTFIAIEVKAPESYGGSIERACEEGPTLKQMAFGRRIQQAGGHFAVVASREQFLETLAAVDALNRDNCYYCQTHGECDIHPVTEMVVID